MTTMSGAPDLNSEYIAWFKGNGMNDVASIGGKGASLGEMYSSLTEKGIEKRRDFCADLFHGFERLYQNRCNYPYQ